MYKLEGLMVFNTVVRKGGVLQAEQETDFSVTLGYRFTSLTHDNVLNRLLFNVIKR